ncbi:MAG: DUF6134 family protein [Alphaproteobacteria bacterium]|nr:DUF6134 family protein [Alphaproteobacteria bacterium]
MLLRTRMHRAKALLGLVVGVGLVVSATAPSEVAAQATPVFVYEMFLDSSTKMGTEEYTMRTLEGGPNSFEITSKLRIDFSPFLFVKVKVTQDSNEVWKNGQLQTFQSQTNDRGDRFQVKAASGPNGITINGSKVKAAALAPDSGPNNYLYLPLIANRKTAFDVKHGEAKNINLIEQGKESVTYRGKEYPVLKYVDTQGDDKDGNDITLWYFETGILFQREYKTQGSKVTHRLK